MAFFTNAISTLSTIVTALGAGTAFYGAFVFLQGQGADNPADKNKGINSLMAGGGLAFLGYFLVPQLANLF